MNITPECELGANDTPTFDAKYLYKGEWPILLSSLINKNILLFITLCENNQNNGS
jgi:hypothetical protein